jgi:hypothetical protein
MYMDECKGQGLQWTLRRGSKIVDSSEPTSLAAATPEATTDSSDVVDRLAQAILKARATESASVPAGAEPSDADSLARAILDARNAKEGRKK